MLNVWVIVCLLLGLGSVFEGIVIAILFREYKRKLLELDLLISAWNAERGWVNSVWNIRRSSDGNMSIEEGEEKNLWKK